MKMFTMVKAIIIIFTTIILIAFSSMSLAHDQKSHADGQVNSKTSTQNDKYTHLRNHELLHVKDIQHKSESTKPFWTLGRLKRGTMILKDGNLSCAPYNCAIKLKKGEYFVPAKGVKHIYALMKKKKGHAATVQQYFFYSDDIVNIPAYSGYPIACELSIDPHGVIVFAHLVAMNEPIFIEGIPIQRLVNALNEYSGKNIRDHISVKKTKTKNAVTVDLITGATVSSLVLNQTVLESARKAARELGILENTALEKITLKQGVENKTWQQLVEMKAISHLVVTPKQMGLQNGSGPWLDLYVADLSSPMIGVNLLGESSYKAVMDSVKSGRSSILIINNGSWSFKGSAFVRGGIYDRFNITQGLNLFTFRDFDYEPLYSLIASGAPDYREAGIFIISSPQFNIAEPWTLNILGSRLTYVTAVSKMFKSFKVNYSLPNSLYTVTKTHVAHNGSISIVKMVWKEHIGAIIWYAILWFIVIGIFAFRRQLSRNFKFLDRLHFIILIASFITVGLYQAGQPSVVNVATFFGIASSGASFALFFKDPYLAMGWIFIILTVIIWGRSLFCGWLCPFGALQEILFRLRVWLTPYKKNYDFNVKVNKNLRYLRYLIFIVIFLISLFSFGLSEIVADKVEPFKTIWNVGILHRPIGYGLFIFLILLVGTFSYRFYCRYVCPLGAALSIISIFPFVRIKRRNTCVICKLCRKDCESQAINQKGQVDAKECLGCMSCINKMHDKKFCPPLRNKKLWNKNNEQDI